MFNRLALATSAGALLSASAFAQTQQPPAAPAQTAPAPSPSPSTTTTAPSTGAPATQAAPSAIRAVDPTTLVLTFYSVQPADMLAATLIGTNVYNTQNESVGEIENLVIDDGKRVRAVVIGIGGFLGMGERYVAVDPNSIVITRAADGSITRAVVNTTREALRAAPEFKFQPGMQRRKS